jgi:hypothetical protein
MKGGSFLGWFRWARRSVQEIIILPWLPLSAQYKILFSSFPHRTLFLSLLVPIAQQPGQAGVLGRLSLLPLKWYGRHFSTHSE